MKTLALTVAAFGLSVATAYVVAQTAPTQGAVPTTTSPPITTPPNTTPPPADTLGNPGTQGMQDRTTRSSTMDKGMHEGMAGSQGMHTPFDKLDTTHKGYITKDGVGNDRWLAQHFAGCDGNSDGQLTRTEYSGCTTSTLRKSGTP